MQTACSIDNSASRLRIYSAAATGAAESRLLNEDEIRASFLPDENRKYLGKGVPDSLISFLPEGESTEEEFLAGLDALSAKLRLFDFAVYRREGFHIEFRPDVVDMRIAGAPFRLTYAGSGNFGLAFRMDFGSESLLLKTFYHCSRDLLFSGPFSEAALGIFVTAKGVRNMPHLFAANPYAGWLLTEFISREKHPSRSGGPTWQDLGLYSMDPGKDGHNEIDIDGDCAPWRFDYGHLSHSGRVRDKRHPEMEELCSSFEGNRFLSEEAFREKFERIPQARFSLFRHLGCLAPEKRLPVLSWALQHPEVKYFRVHDFFETKALARSDAAEVFRILMRHPEPTVRGRAIFNLATFNPAERRLVIRMWEELPEFTPFSIFRKGGRGFDVYSA